MTVIVIEGPDGSGKTTFVKELVKRLPEAQVIHHGPPTDDKHIAVQYAEALEQYRPGSGEHLIFDRLHLGELVYGPLLRGESRLTPAMVTWLHLLLESRGAFVQVLLPPLPVIQQRFADRGDDLIAFDQLQRLWNGYDELSREEVVHYTERGTPSPLATIHCAEWHEKRVALLDPYPRYGGQPFPEVLFVGDTPGTPKNGIDPLIPFIPLASGCGEILFNALARVQLPSYGVTNSDGIDLRGLWNALYGPRVVALGNLASQRLEAAQIPHTKVQHPQYVRRFRARGTELYSCQLEEAATGRTSWLRERMRQIGDC